MTVRVNKEELEPDEQTDADLCVKVTVADYSLPNDTEMEATFSFQEVDEDTVRYYGASYPTRVKDAVVTLLRQKAVEHLNAKNIAVVFDSWGKTGVLPYGSEPAVVVNAHDCSQRQLYNFKGEGGG